jgi:hypothetical protein
LCSVPGVYATAWLLRPDEQAPHASHWTTFALRWPVPLFALGVHFAAGIDSGEWLAHAGLASAGLFLRPQARASTSAAAPRLDARLAAALLYSGLLLVAVLLPTPVGARAAHVLRDVGLAPSRSAVAPLRIPLWFRDARGQERPIAWIPGPLQSSDVRSRLLLSRLVAHAEAPTATREGGIAQWALHVLARSYCDSIVRAGGSSAADADVEITKYGASAAGVVLARFTCDQEQPRAHFIHGGTQ